jgi:2-hydroxychromene-2-carboxylate isomerase
VNELPTNAHELMRMMIVARRQIDEALQGLRQAIKDEAQAELEISKSWSAAYVAVADEKTVGERDAKARKATAEEQYRYTLAKGMTRHASKLLDSRMAWLSALQSAASAMRREAELARWEPREVAEP